MSSKLIFFVSFFFFSFLFSASLTQEEDIYNRLKDQWQRVDYIKPLGFDTIFEKLDSTLWPALPDSYEWRIESDGSINLYKHKAASDRNINFVTYFTDSLDRFNFLSRWDGTTQHSFAYTRKDLRNDYLRKNVVPVDFPGYMCGHCIDFLDTQGISEISICPKAKGRQIINIESISTLDPRNYIPEPLRPTPYWGETARRDFVSQIRQNEGAYAQYMYYMFVPPRTPPPPKINGTAVPWGVYFVQTLPSIRSYNILWPYPIENPDPNYTDPVHYGDNNWQQRLKVNSNFFPAPFVHDLSKKNSRELSIDFPFHDLENIAYAQLYELFIAANHEVKSILGKSTLIQYLLLWHPDSRLIATWIERLISHVEIFKSIEVQDSSLEKSIRILCDALTKSKREEAITQESTDNQLIIHLHGLLPENLMNAVRVSSSLRLKQGPSYPIVYVDGKNTLKANKDNLRYVVSIICEMLRKTPPVHIRLIDLCTAGAKNVWEEVAAEFFKGTYPTETAIKQLQERFSCTINLNAKQKKVTHFTDCMSPHFFPPAPLLDPIEVEGSGETQEVVERILKALEENHIAHIFLRNLPYTEGEFKSILDKCHIKLKKQEKKKGILKEADLQRLSNYTIVPKGFSFYIQQAFKAHNICATQLSPAFVQTLKASAILISKSSASLKPTSDVTISEIDSLSASIQQLDLDQAQKALPLLQQKLSELTSNLEQKEESKVESESFANESEVDELMHSEDMIMMNKEYTVRDIANLIKCNLPTSPSLLHFTLGDNALENPDQNTPPENILYNLGSQYILPSYSPQSLIPCLREFFNSLHEREPNDVVIPYNSGMHWVTLRIRINDHVYIDYIDSLFNEHTDINTARDEQVTRSLASLNALLEKLFPQKIISNIKVMLTRLQKDFKACGPIAVENIKDIMQGTALPTSLQLSNLDILNLRRLQNAQLESVDKKLD